MDIWQNLTQSFGDQSVAILPIHKDEFSLAHLVSINTVQVPVPVGMSHVKMVPSFLVNTYIYSNQLFIFE